MIVELSRHRCWRDADDLGRVAMKATGGHHGRGRGRDGRQELVLDFLLLHLKYRVLMMMMCGCGACYGRRHQDGRR